MDSVFCAAGKILTTSLLMPVAPSTVSSEDNSPVKGCFRLGIRGLRASRFDWSLLSDRALLLREE